MIATLQNQLKSHNIDGWLAYDFRGNNQIALSLLNYPEHAHLTRRSFFWIPKTGAPEAIIHPIDAQSHSHLSFEKKQYTTWQELDQLLTERISHKTVAVEYWPRGSIPTFSLLDAGTFQYLESKGAKLTSSWPILAPLLYTLDEPQQKSHLEAAAILETIVSTIISNLTLPVTEWTIQQEIIKQLKSHNLTFDHPPIVAFGANAALPHYEPTEKSAATLTQETVVLIDLWGRFNQPRSVYADLTIVFYFGSKPPVEIEKAYNALYDAQDQAITYVRTTKYPKGCDIDQICRNVIGKHGFGDYFTHRTGHNITSILHGPGPNIDGFETYDDRTLLPSSCFSIEPGIYIPGKFGLRTECNILIQKDFSVVVQGKAPPKLPRSL